MTDVKNVKSREASGSYATLDIGLPSVPARSFVTDICLWFVRGRGDWLRTATWVSLLGVLDIPGPTARTALHRLTTGGFLQRQARNGKSGYAMSPAWLDYIRRGYYGPPPPESADKWALLTFSIPEARRADRHAIRTQLGRLGFASLGNGVWIGSAARLTETRVALELGGLADYVDLFEAEYEGFARLSEFVRRCWDIDAIAAMYRSFIGDVRRRLKHDPGADSRTFADVVLTSNNSRRINFRDPGLPKHALPTDWPRDDAQHLMDELLSRSLDPARQYVDSLHNG